MGATPHTQRSSPPAASAAPFTDLWRARWPNGDEGTTPAPTPHHARRPAPALCQHPPRVAARPGLGNLPLRRLTGCWPGGCWTAAQRGAQTSIQSQEEQGSWHRGALAVPPGSPTASAAGGRSAAGGGCWRRQPSQAAASAASPAHSAC